MHSYKKIQFDDTESIWDDLLQDVPRSKLLASKATVITTVGSCFAENLAIAVSAAGYNANNITVNEHHNTPLFGSVALDIAIHDRQSRFHETFASLVPEDGLGRIKKRLETTDLLVMTLGVGFDWRTKTGEVRFVANPRHLDDYEAHFPTPAEHATVVGETIATLRMVRSDLPVVLTLSPVPLLFCTKLKSQIVADCLSKTLLRVAAHIVCKKVENVTYFPSFEFFRWASGHQDRAFFGSDGIVRHPDNDLIDLTVKKFIEINGGASGSATQSP